MTYAATAGIHRAEGRHDVSRIFDVTLTDSQADKLEAIAADSGTSKHDLLVRAIAACLEDYEPQPSTHAYEISSSIYDPAELRAFLGECLEDYDIDAIESEATVVRGGTRYWAATGDELVRICARHDRTTWLGEWIGEGFYRISYGDVKHGEGTSSYLPRWYASEDALIEDLIAADAHSPNHDYVLATFCCDASMCNALD